MQQCKECNNTLKGKQTSFCSSKCKNSFHNRIKYSEENKVERLRKNKIWRDNHKEEISKNKAEYYQKHRDKLLAIRKKYSKEHPEIDKAYKKSPKGQIMIYKRGARKRKLVFELDLNYFKEHWNGICYYCGDKIKGIGIDRVDNLIGYTEDNVVNCCEMCNRMKLDHTKDIFINHCNKIINNMKETTSQTIKRLVEESKGFQDPTIEYSFELPKDRNIKADSFFGVKARYNKDTKKANIIFHY